MNEPLNFDELKAAGKLPSPKGAALRVMHLCQHETVSMPELASAIQTDPALAGRIIKIANYVNPNKSRPIASVSADTLLLIGIHAVRQAAMGMSLITNYRDGPCKGFDYEQFWSLAVVMGSAAEAIAEASRIAPAAEMFNCGLMHDIGRLALTMLRPQACSEMYERLRDATHRQILDMQHEMFGVDEREMLLLLLQDWGIPKVFQDALFHCKEPSASEFPAESRQQHLVLTLQLAHLLARACMQEQLAPELAAQILDCGRMLDIGPEQLESFIKQSAERWEAWGHELNIKTRPYAARKLSWDSGQVGPGALPRAVEVQPASHPLHIMLAGADDAQRAQTESFLKAAGHAVIATDNGLAALGLAAGSEVQVVIADWLIPGVDGIQLCVELRKAHASKPLYFILLSPFEDERRRMQAYEAGVDEIMRTPLNPRLLTARLLAAQRIAYQRA
jgi:HD-like signal output (HDOD) protein